MKQKKPPVPGFKECKLCSATGDLPNGSFCHHCQGYGWIPAESCETAHEFIHVQHLGRCYEEYVCQNCGVERKIDSSD